MNDGGITRKGWYERLYQKKIIKLSHLSPNCIWRSKTRMRRWFQGFDHSDRDNNFSVLPMLVFRSVQFSHLVVSNSLWPHGIQHTRPPCLSPTPRVYPRLCPLSWWCHPTILLSVAPFSFCLQSFPASGSFPMSQIFALKEMNIDPDYLSFAINI